jgi:hypothetical protein
LLGRLVAQAIGISVDAIAGGAHQPSQPGSIAIELLRGALHRAGKVPDQVGAAADLFVEQMLDLPGDRVGRVRRDLLGFRRRVSRDGGRGRESVPRGFAGALPESLAASTGCGWVSSEILIAHKSSPPIC